MAELRVAPHPHTLEFLRYDLRFNRLSLKWETLEEIRKQGKYVRDAREEVGVLDFWALVHALSNHIPGWKNRLPSPFFFPSLAFTHRNDDEELCGVFSIWLLQEDKLGVLQSG